jgi:methylmalonyl-CoA mutase
MADLQLGEAADEADWRALVERGLKGAPWERLVGKTADGIAIAPLYREPDVRTANDEAGFPGAAPFVRGARQGAWLIRQAFAHPDPEQTNREILADLRGGASSIELLVDPSGMDGVAIGDGDELNRALANVILEAAPVALDAGALGLWAAELLASKLKGVAPPGTAFNVDPIGALMRTGDGAKADIADAACFAQRIRESLPQATALRVDARPVHEAGGTEAQEIAAALASGICYLRALTEAGLGAADAARALLFTLSVGPDVLVETAKLRALRLCWARVLEASGVAPEARAAHIHAFTSKRMMTRYDAHTNILRVTCAAFAAAIAGADVITTLPFTDALGLPTPFSRRVARNTQLVLMEEARLDHVADPAGGAWFVEKLTRGLAEKAWTLMQEIEAKGGIVASLEAGHLQAKVATARAARQAAFARRKETITGVTDFPLLGQKPPEFMDRRRPRRPTSMPAGEDAGGPYALLPIRWAEPFEALRERADGQCQRVFFANLGAPAEFSSRAQFARNLLGAGGVESIGADDAYATREAMIDAFEKSGARVALICGTDGAYAAGAENAAQRLKAAACDWLILAGKPGEREAALRAAGVDQFVFTGQDALKELETLHAALGIA